MSWERLQVTDPSDTWKNLFETGEVRFTMDLGQLLRAKFIIETVRVEGLVLGTQRDSDGALESEAGQGFTGETGTGLSAQADTVLGAGHRDAPMFDLGRIRRELNLDSLTNPRNLETYVLIDSLTRQLETAEAEWSAGLNDVRSARERAATIEAKVKAIDVGAINSVESAQRALKDAQEAYETSREVVQTFEQRKASLVGNVNGFSERLGTIDNAARRDFQRVIAAAKLPDVSMKGLAQLVLGQEILSQATEYLGYVDLARETIPKYTPKPDPSQPRRSEGVVVHFPEERSYPKLWIKEVLVSGGSDSSRDPDYFYASGTIRNITNNQKLTGEPLTANLEAKKGTRTAASLQASFDRRQDVPRDQYRVDVSGIRVGDLSLGSSAFLPSRISNAVARAEVTVDVPGNKLESSAKVSFASLDITFDKDPASAVERLTRDVLASVRSFFVNLRLWRKDSGELDMAFATDLDDQLAARARSVIGAEVARLRSEIQQRVEAQISQKRRDIERLYAQKRAEVQSRLSSLERDIRSAVASVETKRKELEQRVEQEKKKAEDALKKKAGDVLKGILRKNE